MINTRAVLTFQGSSIDELNAAFAIQSLTMRIGAKNAGKSRSGLIPVPSYSACLPTFIVALLRQRRDWEDLNGFIKDALEKPFNSL